jgi:2-polyprenyl-3-methyl-5-hydroxy-6-metoxy-1,4-benzoquinol methylase
MTVRTDPEGNEIEALFQLVDLDQTEVLEIGCGDGRLTWRYADRAARVTAIDPFPDSIARARAQLAKAPLPIGFRVVSFEDFATETDARMFDVALLSWSLC